MIAALAAAALLAAPARAVEPPAPGFENVAVAFEVPGQARGVVHVYLRRRSPTWLYDVTIDLGGGATTLVKSVPGESGAAERRVLAPALSRLAPADGPRRLRATIVDGAGGSVTLSLFEGERLVARAVDDGATGGPPIRGPGQVAVLADAGIRLAGFSAAPVEGQELSGLAAVADSDARAPQRFLTPWRADGVNDSAVFGPGAVRVAVFDLRGRKRYEAGRAGALRWDGRDADGRLVESGVYVARIDKSDGRRCFQTFAVAK